MVVEVPQRLGEDDAGCGADLLCWSAFGTKERAVLMKCTRYLCQEASTRTASMAPFRPRWVSLVTSFTPQRPLITSERRKDDQKASSFLGVHPPQGHRQPDAQI